MARVNLDSYSLNGRISNQISTHVTSGGTEWEDGCVLFPEGMVAVMIDHGTPYFRLDAVVGGRQHIRTEYRAITRKGAVRVARRWLRELVEAFA